MVAVLERGTKSAQSSFMGAPSAPLGLRIVSAERAGHVVRLASGKCTVGAAAGCTLRLRGRGFQALHCVILRGPGGTAVRRWSADTRLNGGYFHTSALRVGDRLSFGHVEFEVVELPEDTTFDMPVRFDAPISHAAVAAEPAGLAAALAAEQRQLLGELEEARAALSAQMAVVTELKAQLEIEQSTRASLVDANERLASAQEKLQGELDAARAELTAQIAKVEALTATLAAQQEAEESRRGDTERLTAEQVRLTTELETARAELEALAAKANVLAATVEAEQSAGESLRGENARLVAEQQRLTAELETARAELEAQLAKVNALTATLTNEQAAEVSLRNMNDELLAVQERLTADLNTARAELESQLSSVNALSATLAAEVAARETLIRQHEEQLAAQRQQFAAQTGAWEAAQASQQGERTELEAARQQMDAEMNQLRERLADAQRRAALPAEPDQLSISAMQQLRHDRDAASARVDELERRCAELTASESDLRDETERLAGALATLKASASSSADDDKQNTAQLAEIKRLNDAVAVREAELAKRIAEVEHREEQINQYVDELARQQAELDQQRAALLTSQEIGTTSENSLAVNESPAPSETAAESQSSGRKGAEDVSSILARYSRPESANQASGGEMSYTSPQHSAESKLAHAAESATAAQSAARHEGPAEAAEEDSIEAYMARLLNRVRGEAEPVAPVAAPNVSHSFSSSSSNSNTEAEVELAEPVTAESPAPPRPLDPAQLMRRAQMPERTESLAAMRELANHSARSALDTHSKLQWGQRVVEKAIVASASLGCGFALLTSPVFDTSVITCFGAVVSLGTGIAWTCQAIRTFKEGKEAQKLADESLTGLVSPQADVAAAGSEFAPEMSAEETLASVNR